MRADYRYQHDQDGKADRMDDRLAIRIVTTPAGGSVQGRKRQHVDKGKVYA